MQWKEPLFISNILFSNLIWFIRALKFSGLGKMKITPLGRFETSVMGDGLLGFILFPKLLLTLHTNVFLNNILATY